MDENAADAAYGSAADRQTARAALEALAGGDLSALAPDARAEAAHPWGVREGPGVAALWTELRAALPDLERRDAILLAGANAPDARWTAPRASHLVACLGSYVGTFSAPLAGVPPTGGLVRLDYGEAHEIVDGRIARSWLLWDLAGLMMQTGAWPLGPPTGAPGHWPAPRGGGGLRLAPSPEAGSLDRVLAMHAALHAFDGRDVAGIDMRHWAPDFCYWAGGFIRACRGVAGFRARHQKPFLDAFPDRKGAGHFVRLSDGPFAVTGGDVAMTHTGAEYMGVPPTGRRLTFRVMDFYRFDDDGMIAENWLPNDTLGLLSEMGLDVLGRMTLLRTGARF